MIKQIDNWLKDQKREYAFGLSIFLALASSEIKTKYGEYLSSVANEKIDTTNPYFTLLTNKVTDIYNKMKINPDAFKDKSLNVSVSAFSVTDQKVQVNQIIALRNDLDDLKTQISDLEDSDQDKESEIESLNNELDSKNTEIDELKASLIQQGFKVMDGSDLPPKTKLKYIRIKEIVPLMAAIHAELKNTELTDDARKEKAEVLCKLDDERRFLWEEIDNYLENTNSVLPEDRQLQFSEDPFLKGMQVAYRISRLKENITRAKTSAENHQKKGKVELEKKTLEKIASMETELSELESLVNEKK